MSHSFGLNFTHGRTVTASKQLFWQGRFLFVFTERNMDSNASKIVSLHWKNKALLDILNSRSTCKVILKLTGGKDISIQKWHH